MFIDTFVSKGSKSKMKVEIENFKHFLYSALGIICKSMPNRSRCDVVTDPKRCAQIIDHPSFKSFTLIDSKLGLLHRKKKKFHID